MKRLLFPILLTGIVLAGCSSQPAPIGRNTTPKRTAVVAKRNPARPRAQRPIVSLPRQLPLALVSAVAKARAEAKPIPVPTCPATFVSQHEDLSFDCPSDWFIWDDLSGSEEGVIVISNRPPMEPGGEGLPDGWFKLDLQIVPTDEASADQLPAGMCKSAVAGTVTVSCARVEIAGRSWVDRIARDDWAEYHSAATESNGWIYAANAIIPLGDSAEEGRQLIASLYNSLRVGDRL
jgi:hypothetical protein